ncbi:MAG: prenyltransferase/squalene oxidase repeat-containing protein [Chloroflexota bacterium]
MFKSGIPEIDFSTGWLEPDIYSTAWVAMVMDKDDKSKPAWPQALEFIRDSQLEDGGWGDPYMYYAHARIINTMTALLALKTWNDPQDFTRIQCGFKALGHYALDLDKEAHEPIGFELLFPSLLKRLHGAEEQFPAHILQKINALHAEKLNLIDHLVPEIHKPEAWWFSMEMLPEYELACVEDVFIDDIGSMATSPAATAAVLRARRMLGWQEPASSTYLDNLLYLGNGSVPFAWPAEIFAYLWILDTYRRAGIPPSDKFRNVMKSLNENWHSGTQGLSYSQLFPINDGDITTVGYSVLRWGGYNPSDDALLALWSEDCTKTYPNERGVSISTNIHLLTALRMQPGTPREDYMHRVTDWLKKQAKPDTLYDDKWHLSPFYTVSHALSAFLLWDAEMQDRCLEFILDHQREDGGWGWQGKTTLEETAHCIIALNEAYNAGILQDLTPLARAAHLYQDYLVEPKERMWIGKALYRPVEILQAIMFATRYILQQKNLLEPTGMDE